MGENTERKMILFIPQIVLQGVYFCLFLGLFFNGAVFALKNKDLISHYFHIDSIYLLFLFLSVGLFFQVVEERNKHKSNVFDSFIAFINKIFTIILIVFFFILSIELINYPNFIYSTVHIIPLNLIQLFLLFTSVAIVYKLKSNSIPTLIIWLAVLGVFFVSLRSTLAIAVQTTVPFSASYDGKMEYLWGDFYRYLEVVRKIVPDNAPIGIPPQKSPWLKEGNALLVRSMLYPHHIYSFTDNINAPSDSYIFFSSGFMGRTDNERLLFPQKQIKCKKIFLFDLKNKSYSIKQCPYIPTNLEIQNQFGLIQI